MSLYIFDTSVLIAHLKGVPAAADLLRKTLKEGDVLSSVLTRTEVEGGMRSGERRAVTRLMNVIEMVPVSDVIASRAGQYLREFRRSHQGIDVVDYVIAASADVSGAELLTLNVKHFPMFPDLEPAFR